jgi:GT2 family glycosyltransferase
VGSLKSYIEGFDVRLGRVNTIAPKLSIIVTNHNYGRYLGDCLESVASQTYPEIECIVVDDNSSDDSIQVIREFIDGARSHLAIKLVSHAETKGQYAAFCTGLEHARGTFIAFLDADDLLLPDFGAEHIRAHLEFAPVAFTSSNQYQIDSDGQVIGGVHPDLLTCNTFRMISTISLRRPFWVWATTSSMMFRRSVLDYVLGDNAEEFRKCADNYLCHFANLIGGSILIPRVLGCYRRHRHNSFSNNPLVGGRLPTGDMRHHPSHDLVASAIGARLLQAREHFIALLGTAGYLSTLGKVVSGRRLRRSLRTLRHAGAVSRSETLKLFLAGAWLSLRSVARRVRSHPGGFIPTDLAVAKRAAKITSYAEYQRHRRDAQ